MIEMVATAVEEEVALVADSRLVGGEGEEVAVAEWEEVVVAETRTVVAMGKARAQSTTATPPRRAPIRIATLHHRRAIIPRTMARLSSRLWPQVVHMVQDCSQLLLSLKQLMVRRLATSNSSSKRPVTVCTLLLRMVHLLLPHPLRPLVPRPLHLHHLSKQDGTYLLQCLAELLATNA